MYIAYVLLLQHTYIHTYMRTYVAWVVFLAPVSLYYFLYFIHTYIHTYVLQFLYIRTWCFTLPAAVGGPRASHTSNSNNSWKGRCHILHPVDTAHHVTKTWSGWCSCCAVLPLYCERKPYHPHMHRCSCLWVLTPTRDASSWVPRGVTLTKAGKCAYYVVCTKQLTCQRHL